MKILGIDYGERKIGLSISEGFLASPLRIETKTKDFEKRLKDFCQKEKIDKIVIGLSEGKMVQKQKEFGKKVADVCNIPVAFWDETLTSKKAVQEMIGSGVSRKKRRREDAVAAALILQSFLEAQK